MTRYLVEDGTSLNGFAGIEQGIQKMAGSKNIFEVKVAGLPLKIRSSHDQETVNQLVQNVDEKIKQAMALNKSGSFQDSMLLALLNMAEELTLLKKQARRELEQLENKARTVVLELESSRVGLNS